MPFISSFDVISVVVLLCEAEDERRCPDPKIILCIPASPADAVADTLEELKYFWLMVQLYFSLGLILFLARDQEVYQEILLFASSSISEVLIT